MSNIHFRTALDYIRRSPFQALAAVFVLTLTFFVATLVSVLTYSSSKLISYFETRPQVIAFLKDDAPQESVALLQHQLEADTRIKETKYVSKEEALSIYKKATSDNPLLGELVSPSIFPASIEFSVGFTAALGSQSNLNDVVSRLKTVTTYIRFGGGVFVGILSLASFVVLFITISMRMLARKDEVEILDLIGATQGFIRSPIMIEAFVYTAVGVFLGWIIAFIGILYMAPSIVSYFGEIPVLPRDTLTLLELFGITLGLELVSGAILAAAGSLFAISRVKKAR